MSTAYSGRTAIKASRASASAWGMSSWITSQPHDSRKAAPKMANPAQSATDVGDCTTCAPCRTNQTKGSRIATANQRRFTIGRAGYHEAAARSRRVLTSSIRCTRRARTLLSRRLMSLATMLTADVIAIAPPWRTFASTIDGLVDLMVAARTLSGEWRDDVRRAVALREAEGSTAVPEIAIGVPHARVGGLPGAVAALAIAPDGLYE